MKTLVLIRHAKSNWTDPLLSDHDRPLSTRGRRAASDIGSWLSENKIIPDQALVSSAIRARETFKCLGINVSVRNLDGLYVASENRLMRELSKTTGATVLMVAHNPGIAIFAENMVRTPPDHLRFFDYPTCATLVADFDIDEWSKITPKSGIVRSFIVPKDIKR